MKLIPIMKRLIPVLMVISITMCIVSCEGGDGSGSGDPRDVTKTPESFYLEKDMISASYEATYIWDTTLTQARVHFRVHDFESGSVIIYVWDDNGRRIFSYATGHDHVDDNDLEYTNTTLVGKPGDWRIELEYEDFTGEARLTMD
jgi:hypothetical protein